MSMLERCAGRVGAVVAARSSEWRHDLALPPAVASGSARLWARQAAGGDRG